MTALLLATAAIPAVLLIWFLHRFWARSHSQTATASEWRKGMAALGTEKPVRSVLDAKGRRVWSERRGAFVRAASTWNEDAMIEPVQGKVAPIDKRKQA